MAVSRWVDPEAPHPPADITASPCGSVNGRGGSGRYGSYVASWPGGGGGGMGSMMATDQVSVGRI